MGGTYRRQTQYGETACFGPGVYVRARSENQTAFQLGMGGQYRGEPPKGNWKLQVANKVVGQWDLAAGRPFDKDKDPIIYVPAFKVVTVGGVAKQIQAKFFFFDKATKAFRAVTDTKGIDALVHSIGFDLNMRGPGSAGDVHLSADSGKDGDSPAATFAGGVVTANLPAENQAAYGCNESLSEKCIESLGMSYHIGSVSYRLELRKSTEWLGSDSD